MADPAPDIEQVLRDNLAAMVRGDLDQVDRQLSRDPSVLSIGTDANEWAEGHDTIMGLLRESAPGELGFSAGLDDVKAFREGDVGWAVSRGYFEAGGKRVHTRTTVVVHREDGEWKALHAHSSIGVPNDHMLDPMFQSDTEPSAGCGSGQSLPQSLAIARFRARPVVAAGLVLTPS
jgi:ketosteroid isomerase-like protein